MNVESLYQEFRLASRGLWRARTFTIAAVLTLALGIAGTTVMFALIQGVLLRPLPVPNKTACRCVEGGAHFRLRTLPIRQPEIEAVAEASRLLATVPASRGTAWAER